MPDPTVTPVPLEAVVSGLVRVVFVQATQIASLQQARQTGSGWDASSLVLLVFGLAVAYVGWRLYVRVRMAYRLTAVIPSARPVPSVGSLRRDTASES